MADGASVHAWSRKPMSLGNSSRRGLLSWVQIRWFLLRLSLHDPLLALNIESEQETGVRIIAKELQKFFKDFSDLNISEISEYLGS